MKDNTRPIIGVSAAVDEHGASSLALAYTEAIERAGGAPLILPYTEDKDLAGEYARLCDGFYFSGGFDIAPTLYGEEKHPKCGAVQPERDKYEICLFRAAYKTEKPILGICRGAQLLNVALGGTLIQDLPSEIGTEIAHVQHEPKDSHSHSVRILPGTPLEVLLGTGRIKVNSFHHQAIKDLGNTLAVMALADDGTVEAVYATDGRYLRAYQWHPERLCAHDGKSRRIFDDFIAACIAEKGK